MTSANADPQPVNAYLHDLADLIDLTDAATEETIATLTLAQARELAAELARLLDAAAAQPAELAAPAAGTLVAEGIAYVTFHNPTTPTEARRVLTYWTRWPNLTGPEVDEIMSRFTGLAPVLGRHRAAR